MNTGERPSASRNRLLTTVAWRRPEGAHYALEGSVFIAGAAVQWLRDGLGIIETRRGRGPARGERARQRRRVLRARARRAGLALLGPARARHHRRPHPRLQPGAPGARDAGGHRLPERGAARRHGGRFRHSPHGAARGRRRDGERPAHADPGRPAGRAGGAPAGDRDHGARRGLPRGPRGRDSGRTRRRSPRCGRASASSSRGCRPRRPRRASRSGAARSSARATGRRTSPRCRTRRQTPVSGAAGSARRKVRR